MVTIWISIRTLIILSLFNIKQWFAIHRFLYVADPADGCRSRVTIYGILKKSLLIDFKSMLQLIFIILILKNH